MASSSSSFSPTPPTRGSPQGFKRVKKQQPFMLFAFEKQQSMPELRGLKAAALAKNAMVSEMWTSLPPEEREKWVRAAKEYNEGRTYSPIPPPYVQDDNARINASLSGKFTNTGKSMLAKKLEEDMEKYREKVMLNDIITRLAFASEAGALSSMRIHILHVELWLDSDDYSPVAEVGLVEMTLRKGIKYVVSQLIDPGDRKIPKGLSARVMSYAEKHHKLWTDTPDLCKDYAGVLREIVNRLKCKGDETPAGHDIFVEHDESLNELIAAEKELESASTSRDLLPVFVMPDAKRNAQKGLDWIMKKADAYYHFALYDLDHLLLELVNLFPLPLAERQIPSVAMASMELKREIFLYERSVVCDYHGQIECTVCAPAIAQRQAFIVCDFGCQGLDLRPVEGCHLPYGALNRSRRDSTFGGGDTSSARLDATFSQISAFGGGPDSRAIDAQKIPENKHELYQFFEGGEFCFDRPDQNYTSEIIFAGRGRKLESAISEMSLADPRSGYYTTTEDFETACDTDDESSNAIAAGLPKPLRKKKAARQ